MSGGLRALCIATGIGSVGLGAGGTAGGALATEISGGSALAGVPVGLVVVGSAAAALAISRRSARAGRTSSLALGYAVGALGGLIVVAAAALHSLAALLGGSLLLGSANAAVFLTRYAAAELAPGRARGRALGSVLLATALGAILSPNLLGPSGALAHALGLPRLAGLYLVAPLGFLAAAAILLTVPRARPSAEARLAPGRLRSALVRPRVRTAMSVLAASNFVMVGIMAIAPVQMMDGGESIALVGVVVSVHVAGMFGPSPLTGRLADRRGARTVTTLGAGLFLAAAAGGVVAPAGDTVAMTIVLALLGLAWNCGVVGGSTLLTAAAPAEVRTQVEGIGETVMGIAAAAGAPMAGLVLAAAGPPAVWVLTTGLAALTVLARGRVRRPRESPP